MYSEEVNNFINIVKDTCAKNNIEFMLSEDRVLKYPISNTDCSGFFTDQPKPVLGVATKKPLEQWLSVLVHESCHMDQYLEQCKVWTEAYINGVDAVLLLDEQLLNPYKCDQEKLNDICNRLRDVELDCERRVIEKIKKYNLPIDIVTYTKKANSYVYFYNYIKESRQWYSVGFEPYNIPQVWEMCPDTFDNDYTDLNPTLYNRFRAYLI